MSTALEAGRIVGLICPLLGLAALLMILFLLLGQSRRQRKDRP